MLWSSLNVVVMTILFMYMVNKAKCAETRKLALVPLATAAVELLAAGLLRPGLYPALTALLIAMRLVIIGCCVAALRRDAAMAKSRQKKLDKIERMAPPTGLTKPVIRFKSTGITAQRILEVKDLEVGYYYPLLPKLHFVLEQNQRVVITGFNGIGKSTLLKTLIGEISPISGSFEFARNVVIGYYEQDLKWDREGQTPLEIITEAFPKLSQKQTRCGVKAEHVLQPITTLSGGEQSRVKLCKLTLSPCNLLILDEPTNHLDYLAKESLQEALQDFDGTVILVSHEAAFYRDWADKVVEIEKMGF